MGYQRERTEKLERAIEEFLSHSVEFMDITVNGKIICPSCGVENSNGKVSELNHRENCYLTKLQEALKEDE